MNIISGEDFLKNIRLLICEDNIVNIKLIKNLFKNQLTQIQIAENGKLAIEILRTDKNFDAIIMDIHMPEMDGVETTKYIRNKMEMSIPIIGFTANSSKSERDLCLISGMNDYLTKTFIAEDFYEKMSKALPWKKVYSEDLNNMKTPKRKCSSCQNMVTKFKEEFSKNIKNPSKISKKNSSTSLNKKLNHNDSLFKNNTNDYVPIELNILHGPLISSKFSINSQINELDSIVAKESLSQNYLENFNNFVDFKAEDLRTEMFNPEKLKEISGDDADFENEVIDLFLDDFPNQLDALEDAIRNMNEKDIKFSVHKMKSPLSMFGFDYILEKLDNIEYLFYRENLETLLKEFYKVVDDVQNTFKLLRHYVNSLSNY